MIKMSLENAILLSIICSFSLYQGKRADYPYDRAVARKT